MVGTDSTAGVLESFLRDGISLEHDAVPRAYRQDIRGHPVELPVRNLDEIEPEFFQSHMKGGRQKPRIDDSQILVDEADQRHQMEASLRSLVVRERDGFHLDPGSLEEFAKPKESLRVRPKTLAHRKEIVSDPQEIAALGGGWGSQRSEDGHAVFVKSLRDRRLFPFTMEDGLGDSSENRERPAVKIQVGRAESRPRWPLPSNPASP